MHQIVRKAEIPGQAETFQRFVVCSQKYSLEARQISFNREAQCVFVIAN